MVSDLSLTNGLALPPLLNSQVSRDTLVPLLCLVFPFLSHLQLLFFWLF